MSRIIINEQISSLSSKEEINEKKAIFSNNIIYYNHNGFTVNIKFLDEKIFIDRENHDVKINLEFEKNKSLITDYFIKDINLNIKLKTITKNILIRNNSLYIEYDLYMNDEFSDSFKFKLEWRDL